MSGAWPLPAWENASKALQMLQTDSDAGSSLANGANKQTSAASDGVSGSTLAATSGSDASMNYDMNMYGQYYPMYQQYNYPCVPYGYGMYGYGYGSYSSPATPAPQASAPPPPPPPPPPMPTSEENSKKEKRRSVWHSVILRKQ